MNFCIKKFSVINVKYSWIIQIFFSKKLILYVFQICKEMRDKKIFSKIIFHFKKKNNDAYFDIFHTLVSFLSTLLLLLPTYSISVYTKY